MTTTKKPVRRIPDTPYFARTDYRSSDASIREYTILSEDKTTELGRVTWHGSRIGRSAGYHEGHGSYRHDLRSWFNLAEAARDLAREAAK